MSIGIRIRIAVSVLIVLASTTYRITILTHSLFLAFMELTRRPLQPWVWREAVWPAFRAWAWQ